MIEVVVPSAMMIALRWALLLGPIALMILAAAMRPPDRRAQIGALFAFLYGLGMIFVAHQIALYFGWWRFGWDALMLQATPGDLLVGGAILFGPTLFLAAPGASPAWLCAAAVVGLHGAFFRSLEPLVIAGPDWFLGVAFVFAVAHAPALYLARWTADDRHLLRRVALLAVMFGANAFVLAPSLVMAAMGGAWALGVKQPLSWAAFAPAFALSCLIGLAAAHILALQGRGTAIPLDPTRRLVRTGVYAYVSNPMQLSAALGWIVLGLFLSNLWVALSAAMAWVFVMGMVRWHHRHDLLARFPEGWPEYRANAPEWLPRWRPWVKARATLRLDPANARHAAWARWLEGADGLDRVFDGEKTARYDHPLETRIFEGPGAIAMALTHRNFACALLGHAALLLLSLIGRCGDRARGAG